jgi:mono/diheme cytochrome c family protein
VTHSTPLSRRTPPMRWLAALGLLLLPTSAHAGLADLRITELAHHPAGQNGAQWIELMNAGVEPVEVNWLWIGADNSDRAVPLEGLAPVPPGGFLVVHWNAPPPDTPTRGPAASGASQDFHTGALAALRPSHGSLCLSRDPRLFTAAGMLAFIQWGAGRQNGADAAQERGLWPQEAALPALTPGGSLALAPGGSTATPHGWFDAATPTPGALNTGPVSAWRGWRLVGVSAIAPAATWNLASDRLDVIGVTSLGRPVHYRHQAEVWSPGLLLDGMTRLPMGLAGSSSSSLDLVWTDPDGTIWYRRLAGDRWGDAVSLGQGAPLPPALAYNPAAREVELVAVDPAGRLQLARSAGGSWSAWSPVGVMSGPVAPALGINVLDRPFDLVYAAPDGMLKGTHFTGGAWSPPLPSAGYTTLRPAVAVTGAGTVEVVVTAPDGRVYANEMTDGLWGPWRWTGLESDAAPSLLSSSAEYGLELFVTGRDGRLWHSRFVNGVWGRAWPLGAVSSQPAAVTAGADGGLELLAAGDDGSLWHNRFRPASPELVSLAGQVQKIFDIHCVQCHDSGEPMADQNLEPDAAYFSLPNVRSTQLKRMPRVDPGSPDNSYLIHKLSGTHLEVGGSGEPMPMGGRLTEDEIQTLRKWIEQGALNN